MKMHKGATITTLKKALYDHQKQRNKKIEHIQNLVSTIDEHDSVVREIYKKLEDLKRF